MLISFARKCQENSITPEKFNEIIKIMEERDENYRENPFAKMTDTMQKEEAAKTEEIDNEKVATENTEETNN